MVNLLEIAGDDVAALNDSELRELVGLLCEADCKARGFSPSCVTWGGHQDAKDGGLDVVVENEVVIPNSFIPRANTGFQVKKPDMTASMIVDEMKPKGVLRDSIKSIIERNGSYVIVSSTGSTAAKALQDRRKAMKKAIADETNSENVYVDFYDRGRIATWVRTHPSLILWVRNRVGRSLKGWQPFENWTRPGEAQDEYLVDKGLRLFDGTTRIEEAETSIEDGLNRVRVLLSSPGSCIRLVGLSGVGKTRFVQALFDQSIGDNALNSSQVFYTDMAHGPDPEPKTLAEQLISQGTQSILVVDNCPPELHRKLVEVCASGKSTVSLITVEYDVREDLADETTVFRLEPASDEIILKLISKRFRHISEVDARSIANFSGGNARVAIALASTVNYGETLSGFKNEDLFERLFRQRNETNYQLLKSAQVLALVYSFEGTDTGAASEVATLASLARKSADELYSDIAELKNRDLIQSRSVWRALLPHAIANRLAKKALDSIPRSLIVSTFLNSGSERLLKSFTRRLNFLHDSEVAVQIVNEWLEKDGWLGDVGNLNRMGINILENIAPVSPSKTLEAVERAASNVQFYKQSDQHKQSFIRLLRSLAYYSEYFIRSTRIITLFVISESEEKSFAKDVLKSLFLIVLSGTHALAKVRYAVIDDLISSADYDKQDLGVLLLDTSLESWHFNSHYPFDFGARPRDYGHWPETKEEVNNWYSLFIKKSVQLILHGNNLSEKIKKVLVDNFRGLWVKGGMHMELEVAAKEVKDCFGSWTDLWIEVRTTMHYSKGTIDDGLLRLDALLKPVNLVQKVRTYALSAKGSYLEFLEKEHDNSPMARWQRADEIAYKLGAELAQDDKSLDVLMSELTAGKGLRLWFVGKGLAKGSANKTTLWKKFTDNLGKVEETKRNIIVLQGFIREIAENDITLSNSILDSALNDPILSRWLPDLQASVVVDANGVLRLHKSLDKNVAPITAYTSLGMGRSHQTISDNDLAELLLKILSKENGDDVALDILCMRFHGNEEKTYNRNLIMAGRNILASYRYSKEYNDRTRMDYELSKVAGVCLEGNDAVESTKIISEKVLNAIGSYDLYGSDCVEFIEVISKKQPYIFLDVFVGTDSLEEYQYRRLFGFDFNGHINPLNNIPYATIISWCDINPLSRYERVINLVDLFEYDHEVQCLKWKTIVYSILEKFQNLEKILSGLTDAIWPNSWSNSLADVLQTRLVLLESLFSYSNTEVIAWAKRIHAELQDRIIKERKEEKDRNRRQNESFE